MTKKVKNAPVNEIDETIAVSRSFIEKNLKVLVGSVGGVLLAIILCLLVHQYYIVPNNAEAADKIAVAEQLFVAGDYETSLNGNGTDAGFLQIIEEYGSTPSGNLARLYAGLCYAHTDQYEQAVKYLEDYDACDDVLISNAALGALGNSYAQLGQNEKAASTLLKAAKAAESLTLSPMYYLQAGQIFETLGNNAEALKCYQTIKSEYPHSSLNNDIDKYIERLK